MRYLFPEYGACLFLLALSLTTLPGCDRGPVAHNDPIPWLEDFTRAKADAAAQNKRIFLNFTADWCPPCQEMKKKTFPDEAVRGFLADHFIQVKVDLTRPDQVQQALADQYSVDSIPTFILASADGKPIVQRSGFVPAPEFHAWLSGAVK